MDISCSKDIIQQHYPNDIVALMRKVTQDVTSFGKGIEKPDTASNKLLNKKRIAYILIVQSGHLKKEQGG